MSEKPKKVRSSNFSNEEKVLLIEQVKLFANIIENKGLDPNAHKKKLEAWKKISFKFQSLGYARTNVKLKDTYQRMKHQAKVNIRDFKKGQTSTGGGPKPDEPSDLDYTIMDISPKDFIADEGGMDSDFFRRDGNLQEELKSETESFSFIVDAYSGELNPTTNDLAIPTSSQQFASQPQTTDDENIAVATTSQQLLSKKSSYASPSRGGDGKRKNPKEFSGQAAKKKKISLAESKLVEYHEKRIEHLMETHSINLKYLIDEEERKKKLAAKELEKKNLEIELLKQQLKQENEIYVKNLEIKNFEILALKKKTDLELI